MIEAPESLTSLHPICIANDFSAGSVGCPSRSNAASPVRNTPGVWMGPFPFDEDGVCFLVTVSEVKFSSSGRDCPDPLERNDGPCASSASHVSCIWFSTENIPSYCVIPSQCPTLALIQSSRVGVSLSQGAQLRRRFVCLPGLSRFCLAMLVLSWRSLARRRRRKQLIWEAKGRSAHQSPLGTAPSR